MIPSTSRLASLHRSRFSTVRTFCATAMQSESPSSSSSMTVCKSIQHFRNVRKTIPTTATVGFVPTMGGLHQGHMSLIEHAKREADFVVASIFVNPTQFGKNEDFSTYPRTLDADLLALEKAGVDFVFTPTKEDMYKPHHSIYVQPEGVEDFAEEKCRPGFFRGVSTIVCKLFNVVQPTHAYFGQKDCVQCVIIRQMIEGLDFDINLKIVETSRESDGLAMSTRNNYLTVEERKVASVVYRGLSCAKDYYEASTDDCLPSSKIYELVQQVYASEPLVHHIQYINVSNIRTMKTIDQVSKHEGAIISVALMLGSVRLIDNIVLPPVV